MSSIIAPVVNNVTSPVFSVRIGGFLAAAGGSLRPCGNTFYYRLSTLTVPPTKTALNTIFQSTVMTPLKLATNVRYTPTNANIRSISDATDPEQTFAIAGVGAIATDSEPSPDAVVICLKSAFRGPQGRSFKHMGGASEVDTTGDILTGGSLVLWQAVRDAMKAPLTDALLNVWTPFIRCNLSSQYVTPPIIVRGYDVVTAYLQIVVGTMRKRKSKGIKSF